MRTTQRKGDIATSRAIESAAHDLVVDDGERLARVQSKYAGSPRRQVDLRRIHSNSTGYVVKRARDNSYDWLFVLDVHGAEYLIKECLSNRRSVTLRDTDMLGAVAESG